MRGLDHIHSTLTVNQASRPLRNQPPPFHRKTFLAVCCEMVEAPRRSPPFSAACIAFWISFRSKPSWAQKFWSSEAMTARTMCGDMSLRSTQVERTSMPFMAVPAMLSVGGGPVQPMAKTASRLTPMKPKPRMPVQRRKPTRMRRSGVNATTRPTAG